VLDSIFPPDSPGVAEFRSEYLPGAGYDPLQLLSSVATETGQAGLIATVSTTCSYPWDMARCRATLDFLSHGQAGWNFVSIAEPAAARAEYAGRTLRERVGLPRPARSAAPFPRTGDSTMQGKGERSKATTAASPAGGPR
jgi:alkanesulfonate monooxygenase SsuD/methylene tetrahydromethanopterin reductase-like flavin-dependent oxidoreductase (luciferase family)